MGQISLLESHEPFYDILACRCNEILGLVSGTISKYPILINIEKIPDRPILRHPQTCMKLSPPPPIVI